MSLWSWLAGWLGGAAPIPPPAADLLGAPTLPASAIGDVLPTAALLRTLGWDAPETWAAVLAPACARYGITTRLRLAAKLANVGHETNGGRVLVENLNYTPEALLLNFGQNPRSDGLPPRITRDQAIALGRIDAKNASLYPGVPLHAANHQGIANQIYGGEWGRRNLGNTEPGDGWRFRGRGLMQTTGRANYQRAADAAGRPLEDAYLASLGTPPGAAESAAFFWVWAGCNAPADAGDIERVRRIVNGGQIGIDGVRTRYRAALAAIP
nr:hypothetical protein [uncultured Roseococcus sp.]